MTRQVGQELRELEALLLLHAIEHVRSMRDAARLTGRSPAFIRKTLAVIEQELGGPVCKIRQRAGLELTDLGQELLHETHLARGELSDSWFRFMATRGHIALRIAGTGVSIRYVLPRVTQRFRELRSDVRLAVTRASSPDIARMVASGRVELGVGRDPSIDVEEGRLEAEALRGIQVECYLDSELVAAYPRSYVGPRDINSINERVGWVLATSQGRTDQLLGRALGNRPPRVVATVSTLEDALEWTAHGLAACLTSSLAVVDRYSELSALLLGGLSVEDRYFPGAILWSAKRLRPVAEQFRDLLKADRCSVKRSAGAIVYRQEEQATEVLVLEDSEGQIVIPKGGVESGEDPHQTAIREVKEETGVTGLVLEAPLGDVRHPSPNGIKRVDYYLGMSSTSDERLTTDCAHRSVSWRRLAEWRSWNLKYSSDAVILERAERFLAGRLTG